MDRRRKHMVVGVLAGLAVVAVFWAVLGGGGRGLRHVSGESADAREAMEVIRAIAGDPTTVAAHMVAGAASGVQEMVAETAERLQEAESIRFEEAGWHGGYLRVRVSWPRPEGDPLTRTFFLKSEGGRLRISGLQL
ncbi:MAG: hypothetical protein GXY85_12760 [Candidatus Brocadiaceae bacterium]|nr:hypothetical protein [Candidatus Brocadiaceae bacterium]